MMLWHQWNDSDRQSSVVIEGLQTIEEDTHLLGIMRAFHTKKKAPCPAWFDLIKYEQQAQLDLRGWLIQLGLRRDIQLFIRRGVEFTHDSFMSIIASMIHENPILDLDQIASRIGVDYAKISPSLSPIFGGHTLEFMAVHPTTLDELCRHKYGLQLPIRKYVDQFYAQIAQQVEVPEGTLEFSETLNDEVERRRCVYMKVIAGKEGQGIPFKPCMQLPLFCSYQFIYSQIFFSVDISLPDKLLEAHFKRSLQMARDYLSRMVDPPKQLSTNMTASWSDEQLLAYLDLALEEHIPDGLRLSKTNIANLLWPPLDHGKGSEKGWGVEHLQETTESTAMELMDLNSDIFRELVSTVAESLVSALPKTDSPESLFAKQKISRTRKNRSRIRTAVYD